MRRRPLEAPPALVTCLAYTAGRGWHLSTVDLELVLEAEREAWVREQQQPAPTELKPCGTRAAAVRHRRRGEHLDPACLAAERAWNAARMRRARARPAA